MFFINIVWDHRMSRGSCQDSRWNWGRTKFCFWTHLPVGSSPSSCKEYWKVTIMMISLEGKNSALVFWKTDIFSTSHCTSVMLLWNVICSCAFACRALDQCDAGLFNKLVGIYPELAAHERAVDGLIDFFKKDQVHFKL